MCCRGELTSACFLAGEQQWHDVMTPLMGVWVVLRLSRGDRLQLVTIIILFVLQHMLARPFL